MKTSYFGLIDYIKYPIAICGKRPDWYTESGRPSYTDLAPKIGFFKDWKNGIIDNDGYVKEFIIQVLLKLDPKKVFEDLKNIYPGVDENEITLLCYESSKNGTENVFCHRFLVGAWLRNNGIPCEELHIKNL